MKVKGETMKKAILFAACCAIALGASAQVRKCTGPDGKITYSDFICGKSTANETSVRTDYNTIDSSGSRLDAKRMKTDEAVNAAMQTDGPKCKFAYFAYGDEKGKTLAAAAKQECLNNIRAKANGDATSLEAYGFWKDHSAQKSTDRQASISRAAAAQDAQATRNSIDGLNRTLKNQSYTCQRSNFSNEVDCKPK